MKRIFLLVLACLMTSVIFWQGCANSITGPTDRTPPTLKVTAPLSDSRILIGKMVVTYEASDDVGLKTVGMRVFDDQGNVYREGYYPLSNGSNPTVYVSTDTAVLNKKISYVVIATDKSNNYAVSDTMKNIQVLNSLITPSAPLELTGFLIDNTKLFNLTWNDTSSYIQGYELWKKTGLNGAWFKLKSFTDISVFNTNDSNVDTSVVNLYKLRSYNPVGYSPFSSVVNTYGGGYDTTLVAPSWFSATAFGPKTVYMSWRNASLSSKVVVTKFIIERKRDYVSDFEAIKVLPPNTSNYTDTDSNLTAERAYDYRVKVFSENDSSWSRSSRTTTLKTGSSSTPWLPSPPQSLVGFLIDNTTLYNITWTDTSSVLGYELWKKIGINGTWFRLKSFTDNRTFNTNDSGVDTTVMNLYKLRSYNSTGYSGFSSIVNSYGGGYDTMLLAPKWVSATAVGSHKVYVSWININDGTVNITKYIVERKENYASNYTAVKVLPPNSTNYTDSDATMATETLYDYRVKVFSETDSAWSRPSHVTTLNKPTNPKAVKSDTTATGILLTWSESSWNATQTIIERKSVSDPTYQQIASIPAYGLRYVDSPLTTGETYSYRVRVTDGKGVSDYSDEVVLTLKKTSLANRSNVPNLSLPK